MHDADERDPLFRCHPATREKATEEIVRWIEEPNSPSSVLWVNGRAGVGKTTHITEGAFSSVEECWVAIRKGFYSPPLLTSLQ